MRVGGRMEPVEGLPRKLGAGSRSGHNPVATEHERGPMRRP
jgi:hypothetical protein